MILQACIWAHFIIRACRSKSEKTMINVFTTYYRYLLVCERFQRDAAVLDTFLLCVLCSITICNFVKSLRNDVVLQQLQCSSQFEPELKLYNNLDQSKSKKKKKKSKAGGALCGTTWKFLAA